MASYDENNAKAYVLEKGDYVISINSDSHTVLDQKTYTVDKDVVYKGENKRASDDTAAINVFEDAKGDVTIYHEQIILQIMKRLQQRRHLQSWVSHMFLNII